MAYTDVFGGSTVQPADVQFAEVTLTASITTDWPEFATTTQAVARIMQVSATVASLTIALPDAQLVSNGQDVLFDNAGANTFEVLDYAGAIIATVAPGEVRYLYLDSNATAAGTWRVVAFGSTSSAADASQLAGYGIKATSATLSAAPPVVNVSNDTTVVAADRAKVFVWTGASGTLTLPTTVSSTSDFVIEVRNQGTGTVMLTPVGGVTIDSSSNISLSVNESCFVHMGAADWYTVGRGRNTNFNFTQLSKAVTGGTTALTLTEASNVVQTCTGVLLSNQIVTLPAVVQVYYVRNNTTGAFTLTFACAGGGSSVVVSAAQAAILFCDGTNIINANTSLAGGITALLFGAGSATVPSAAFGTSTNGFYASGTNEVAVTINGTYVGKWTSAGYQGNVALAIAANGLTNATTTVTTSAATAPIAGQVLTATSSTAATWQPPATGVTTIGFGTTGLTPSVATGGAVAVAGILTGANGGTGVANMSKTLTLGGSLITTGAATPTLAFGAATFTYTFPGATGTLADLASAQALTTKTIALGSNTVSGTIAQFNTACTDADFATIAGIQTLTSKTLTGAALNGTLGATTPSTVVATTMQATTGASVGGAAAQSGGVAFPAVAVAVADPNTLDDYEEGTWTPATIGTFTGVSSTSGTYTKIGRLVFVFCRLNTVTSISCTPTTGFLTGLPFVAAAIGGNGDMHRVDTGAVLGQVAIPAGSANLLPTTITAVGNSIDISATYYV